MTDLVVASLEAWDGVWRRNQYLVAGLLRADPALRVLFVEPAADPLHAARRGRRPAPGRGLRPIGLEGAEGRLWAFQPTKLLPRRLAPGADARLARQVRAAARRLDLRDPLLWLNDPHAAALLRSTGWRALYDVTDDWLEADRSPTEHHRLRRDESTLMTRCAEVVVCSPGLVRSKGRQRAVTLVGNGVDVEAVRAPRSRPVDLPAGPLAGYVGTVHTDRIDLDLCTRTARELAGQARLVLVGPVLLDPADRQRLESAGVVLLGAKDRDEVPAYLQHADVLVVPHVVTAFTESLDPIKAYEYRASGRPVVSTPVAGFRDGADAAVTTAAGAAFVAAVRSALRRAPSGASADTAPGPPEESSADAPGTAAGAAAGPSAPDVPTWDERVVQMREVLERVAGSQDPGAAPGRRVLYCHTAAPGGAELAAPALAAETGASLWIRGEGSVAAAARGLGVDVRVLPARSDRRPRSAAGLWSALGDLVRVQGELIGLLRRDRPGVVLSNSLQGLTHLALASRLARVPLVGYVRDLGEGGNRGALEVRAYRALLGTTRAAVFNSGLTRASWGRASGLVVPSAVPESFYDTWEGGDGTCVVMLGRLARWKGQREVVGAVTSLARRRAVRLRIVGGAQFGEQVDPTGLGAAREVLGVVELVPHVDEPWRELRTADVLVHASLTPEPFGQVLAQAAAAGVPIVCADRGGHLEWLEDGVSCLAVDPRDTVALADAIEATLADPAAARARARVARRAADRFHARVAYAPVRELLTRLERR